MIAAPFLEKKTSFVLWLSFFVVVGYGIFLLPFRFPPTTPSISQSWVAGFNNQVSIATTLVASLVVFLCSWFLFERPAESGFLTYPVQTKIPARLVWFAAGIYGVILGTIAVTCLVSYRYLHSDIRYLLDPAVKVSEFGLKPYRDFDFAYGPLILYPPIVLRALLGWTGISLEACYYLTTIGVMIGGLWLTAWVIDELVPDKKIKTILFVGTTLTTINITMGSNGTVLRSLAPFALLLSLRHLGNRFRAENQIVYALCMGVSVCLYSVFGFLISPELGLAFCCSAICWAVVSGLVGSKWLLIVVAAPIIALWSAGFIYGHNIFATIRMYSGGGMNWVVVPYSLMILYLASLIILIPTGVVSVLKSRTADAPTFASLYCLGLCLLPAALSRCDFGHLLLNGMGVFILATAHLAHYSRRVNYFWLVSLVAVLLAFEGMLFFISKHSLALELYDALDKSFPGERFRSQEKYPVPIRELPAELSGDSVLLPWSVDKTTERILLDAHAIVPSYYTDFILVATAADEQRKIDEVARQKWILTPTSPNFDNWDRSFVQKYFLYPVNYRELHASYKSGRNTFSYILDHFEEVRRIGDYTLYRRK